MWISRRMRIQTFVVGSVLALAIFLFAQRHADENQLQACAFRCIVDLTRTTGSDAGYASRKSIDRSETRLKAPAAFAPSLWTVDKIPAERLVAQLVILDVHTQAMGNPGYQVSIA